MVVIFRCPTTYEKKCPHCGSGFIAFDKQDQEPYCCICGWRQATHISKKQARNHFRTEAEFWNALFAREDDPDEI